ncbi:MAG: hypothetical protein ACE15E_23455 [Acidobacteriota bacterium]
MVKAACKRLILALFYLFVLAAGPVCATAADQGLVILPWPWSIGLPSDLFPGSHGSLFLKSHLELFPTARDLWSLLENQDSSSVVNRVDVGGFYGGTFTLFSAHGSSWTQNHFYLNGLNVTDPYEGGKPLVYPDFDSLSEVQVVTAGLGVEAPGGGSVVRVSSEQASRSLRGDARLYYQGRPTGWDNLTARLRDQGATGSRRIRQDFQLHAALGGPLGHSRWAWLGSASSRQLDLRIPRFPEIEQRDYSAGLLDLHRESNRHVFGVRWAGQQLDDSHSQPSFRTPVSSTLERQDDFNLIQGSWRMTASPQLYLDARAGWARANLAGRFQDMGSPVQSGLDLFTEFRTGMAPRQTESLRTRLSVALHLSYAKGGSQITLGVDANRGYSRSAIEAIDDVALRFLPSDLEAHPLFRGPVSASSVIQYNTPVFPRELVRQLAFFAQHAWRFKPSLSLRYGLRVDSSNGWLPAQSSPAGAFSGARSFPAKKGLIDWLDAEPRVAVAWSPFVERKTVFRAGFNILHHDLNGRYLDFANPNSLSGTEWKWNDADGDRQYQPGEAGTVLRRFGGAASDIAPDLRRPYTREMIIGAEQQLPGGLVLRADFFRRDEKDRLETVNVGVPFSSFTPVLISDPGGDYEVGTGDDQEILVYNQDASTLGKDRFLLTNPGLTSFNKGLEMALSYQSGSRLGLALLFSAYMTRVHTNPGNTEFDNDQGIVGTLLDHPNSLVGTYGRQYFDRSYTARLLGYFHLPRNWVLATVTRYYDGLPFGRKLAVKGFNQGPFFVNATPRGNPGGHRTEFNLTADVRLKKTLGWRGHDLGLVLDVFNLLNTSNKTAENDLTGPWFLLRLPVEFQSPRIARLGVELRF